MTATHNAVKMIQKTHYDKTLKKYVKTMVPESSEHKERVSSINRAMSKFKHASEKEQQEHQSRTGRGYNE